MLTVENMAVNIAPLWISNTKACVSIGFWYHGIFTLRADLDNLRFALLRVVTWEYTDGVPMLGDFFP